MNNETILKKVRRRICIGSIAIFIASCYELWNGTNISKVAVVILSLYMAIMVGIAGYAFMKWYIKRNSNKK